MTNISFFLEQDTTRECPDYKDTDLVPPLEHCIRTRFVLRKIFFTDAVMAGLAKFPNERLCDERKQRMYASSLRGKS